MFCTVDSYEDVQKLFRSLYVSRHCFYQKTYNVFKYNKKGPAYLVRGCGKETYVIDGKIFELSPCGFDAGIKEEKEVTIKLSKFSTRYLDMNKRHNLNTDAARAIPVDIVFDVGPIEFDGKKLGTLFVFKDFGTSHAVRSIFEKFVKVRCFIVKKSAFEVALVDILILCKIL